MNSNEIYNFAVETMSKCFDEKKFTEIIFKFVEESNSINLDTFLLHIRNDFNFKTSINLKIKSNFKFIDEAKNLKQLYYINGILDSVKLHDEIEYDAKEYFKQNYDAYKNLKEMTHDDFNEWLIYNNDKLQNRYFYKDE